MAIVLNGVSLNGDFLDADFLDAYENALTIYGDEAKEAKVQMQSMGAGDRIRLGCLCIDHMIDNTFGEGSSEQVFADCRTNLRRHLEVFDELVEACKEHTKDINDMNNKYTQKRNAAQKQLNKQNFAAFVAQQQHSGGVR